MFHRTFSSVLFVAFCLTAPLTLFGQNVTFDPGSRFMLVGDSFTNDGTADWAGKVDAAPEFDLQFFSVAGRRLDQMDTNFDADYATATASGPLDAVVIAGGVNDLSANRTAAQLRSSVESMISRTNGEHIILTTIAPFRDRIPAFWNQVRQDVADQHDAWVRQMATTNPNISVFDIRAILDLNDDQVPDAEFVSADNFHPQSCPLGLSCGMSHIADTFVAQFATASIILGDVNLDSNVNFLDVSPFISVLSSGRFLPEADVNQNGTVDFLDISPFIGVLNGQ